MARRLPTTVSLYEGDKERLEEIVLELGGKSISDLLRKIALGELVVLPAKTIPSVPMDLDVQQKDTTKLIIVQSLLEAALKAISSDQSKII